MDDLRPALARLQGWLLAALEPAAPAVGAAVLPFRDRFLPTRFALTKNAHEL